VDQRYTNEEKIKTIKYDIWRNYGLYGNEGPINFIACDPITIS
jgi:hypothetical protein